MTRSPKCSRARPSPPTRRRVPGAHRRASAPTCRPGGAHASPASPRYDGPAQSRPRSPRGRMQSRDEPDPEHAPRGRCRYRARGTDRYRAHPAWARRWHRTRGIRAQPHSGSRPRPGPPRSRRRLPGRREPPGRPRVSSGEQRPPSRRCAKSAQCAAPGARCARPPTSTRPATERCDAPTARPCAQASR